MSKRFTEQLKIQYPIICGAMYPCSNPELVAAVSEAGGIGIIQPLSLVYVHGYDFRKGMQYIRTLTQKPVGINIIVERSSSTYQKRMEEWLDIALEEGVKFAITALGNPEWVVKKLKQVNGIVYHDVTSKDWALKALDKGIEGLICVNNRAGGHAGTLSPEQLFHDLSPLNVPLICAGGIGDEIEFAKALKIGYDGVQMGTRFIATKECREKDNYKEAIVNAHAQDIVLTTRVTGIPLAVINTPFVQKVGTKVNPFMLYLLKHPYFKKWARTWLSLLSIRRFKEISLHGATSKDYWQAGKSVEGIHKVETVRDIIGRFASKI
jgi:nitronate monooxygenase